MADKAGNCQNFMFRSIAYSKVKNFQENSFLGFNPLDARTLYIVKITFKVYLTQKCYRYRCL